MRSERVRVKKSVTPRGVTVLNPAGVLDFTTAPALEEAITATGRLPCAVVDFSDVTFLDSSGINTLLRANRALTSAGGWIRLSGVKDDLMQTLRIVGLDHVIPVFATLDLALEL